MWTCDHLMVMWRYHHGIATETGQGLANHEKVVSLKSFFVPLGRSIEQENGHVKHLKPLMFTILAGDSFSSFG